MLSDAKGAGSDNIGLKERLHHLLGGRTRITWAEYTNHLNTCLELRGKLGFKMSKRGLELGECWVADAEVGPSLGMGAKFLCEGGMGLRERLVVGQRSLKFLLEPPLLGRGFGRKKNII